MAGRQHVTRLGDHLGGFVVGRLASTLRSRAAAEDGRVVSGVPPETSLTHLVLACAALVYELYNLTPEEIALVEGNA